MQDNFLCFVSRLHANSAWERYRLEPVDVNVWICALLGNVSCTRKEIKSLRCERLSWHLVDYGSSMIDEGHLNTFEEYHDST